MNGQKVGQVYTTLPVHILVMIVILYQPQDKLYLFVFPLQFHKQNETTGQLDRLSVEGSLYIGGYPGTPPYPGVSATNFSGCVESLHLDSNPIVLSSR